MLQEHIIELSIENEYAKTTSLEHRKKFAQFFTPFPIANLMVKWVLGNSDLKSVLEPALGLGIFSRILLSYRTDIKIKAFEVDDIIFNNAKDIFCNTDSIAIFLENYIYSDWESKYDGIICNPPYFKFHDYDNKNIIKEIEIRTSCKLNGFTNLYTLFLIKSIYQLEKNGRCAYIVPSEFLNSDYGKLVKDFLIKSKVLRHIIVINFEENVFDDALTTACIIFCANDNLTDEVCFTNIHSLQDLSKIDEIIANYSLSASNENKYKITELNPEIKWKSYYQKQNKTIFKNIVPFSMYAKVVRGIATGSNEYFTFNSSKAEQFSISKEFLLPCICRAVDAKNAFFTIQDFEELQKNDKYVFLFNAQNAHNSAVMDYIKKGEAEDIHKKFLTANRKPWYALEKRLPAPIWVSVFNRTGLRFVRNEANISNLTSYHCIYPNQNHLFSQINIDLLFAYLLTNTAKIILKDNSREYGNGLEKFEPNDINKGMMLNLGILDEKTISQILELYNTYRLLILDNKQGDEIVEMIDKIMIEKFTL